MDHPPTTRKFQTRSGISRKTKEEREQYAREEAERQQQRLTEAARSPASGVSEKGHAASRGRLTAAVNKTERVRNEGSGGVFGAAVAPLPKSRAGQHAGTASGASEEVRSAAQTKPGEVGPTISGPNHGPSDPTNQEATVKGAKKSTARAKITGSKKDEIAYFSSEEDMDEGEKRDIDKIWISSDEEDGNKEHQGKQRALRSLRAGTGLRPLRATRDLQAQGLALSSRNQVLSEVGKHEHQQVGKEPADGLVSDEDRVQMSDHAPDDWKPSIPELDKKTGKRKGPKVKDMPITTDTAEERAERLRYRKDASKLLDEFTGSSSASRPHDFSEQHDAGHPDPQPGDAPDRRLFLFQFPPLTPFVVDPSEQIEVKQEMDAESTTVPAEGSGGEAAIKKEEGAEGVQKRPEVLTADNPQLPSGLVGTLRVHRSGKVTLDWGGTDMEVRYGTEVDFLQEAVLADEGTSTAWALGQVQKKMVVVPRWDKLYE